MKRIILSLFSILVVGSVVTAATKAYFSDTETSTGNTFAAGTLDLKVNDQDDPVVVHISRTDMKPYPSWSHSYGGQWILKNAGTIPGKFSVKIINIKNTENGCNEPEQNAGDVTCGIELNQGELGSLMYGKWMENHYGIYSPAKGWSGSSVFNPINTAEGVSVNGIVLNPGDIFSAYLDLEWDTHTGLIDNTGQNDGLEFDVVFSLDQVTP